MTAERLYAKLEAEGFEVLFDDRQESAGIKFNDADLLGIPVRVTVSPRTLEKDSVEIKKRTEKEAELVPLDGIAARLREIIGGGAMTGA
jgi:prolyl-tRNA synthetase